MTLFKRKPRIGDTVIRVQADGCMATDWRVLWIGTITSFETQRHGQAIPLARVEVTSQPGGRQGHTVTSVIAELYQVGKTTWKETV